MQDHDHSIIFPFTSKPRVLLHLSSAAETQQCRRIMEANRCRVFPLTDALLKPCATEHYRLDCIAGSVATLKAGLFDEFPHSLPRFALGPEEALWGEGRRFAAATNDIRALTSMVYGACARRSGHGAMIAELDADLAVDRGLGLVFWRNKLLRLYAAERRIFCVLTLWPGRTFEWREITDIGGTDGGSAYTCMGRIRRALRNARADKEYFFTVGCRGVYFSAT